MFSGTLPPLDTELQEEALLIEPQTDPSSLSSRACRPGNNEIAESGKFTLKLVKFLRDVSIGTSLKKSPP
jgi:hypothetical protein